MPIVGQFASLARAGSFLLPGGAFESIATVTVGSGGASSIEFTSIPGTYQHLQIRLIVRSTLSGPQSAFGIRMGNGGVDTGSNYAYHLLYGDGSSALATVAVSQSQGSGGVSAGSTASASIFAAGIIDILDYASTSKAKTTRCLSGNDRNGSGQLRLTSSLWTSTSAVTAITITEANADNFVQYSTAALYGIKAP